jgi:hypothetical protein
MRRAEVRPIPSLRAISDLLTPAQYCFSTWPIWSTAVCVRPRGLAFCRPRQPWRGHARAESRVRTRRRRAVTRPCHAQLGMLMAQVAARIDVREYRKVMVTSGST